MKNISLILSVLFILSCSQSADNKIIADETLNRDGIFIHITESYNDPHRVLMPLKMATMMADDKDVIIYMDIHAVELLVKGAKDLNFADFEPFQGYMKKLIDKNIPIYACPTCLKIAGFKPEDLIDGIQIAQKDKFFNFTNGRIIAMNY